jgi:hypothetical protein
MAGGIRAIGRPNFVCLAKMTGSKNAVDELKKARKEIFGVLLEKLRTPKQRRRKRAGK